MHIKALLTRTTA